MCNIRKKGRKSFVHCYSPNHHVACEIPRRQYLYMDFKQHRLTSNFTLTDRSGTGVLTLFFSSRCCNPGHVTVKKHLYTPDVELLTLSIHPCCLLRGFTCFTCQCCMWHHQHSCCLVTNTTLQCIHDDLWKFWSCLLSNCCSLRVLFHVNSTGINQCGFFWPKPITKNQH